MTEEQAPTIAGRRRSSPMLPGDVDNNPKGVGFLALVAEDFRTHDRAILDPGFWALAIHRFGNWRMGIRPKLVRAPFSLLHRALFTFIKLGFGIELPYVTVLGRGVRIWHHGGIFIGARSIGDGVQLRHNTTIGVLHSGEDDAKPVIGNRVDIGCGAVILGGVEVGDDVVIGANTVVVKDVPAGSTVFGVPARPVRLMPAPKAPPKSGTPGES